MIDYWQKFNLIPWNSKIENPKDAVYIIILFHRKRALLLRKDLSIIKTFETRKMKNLIQHHIKVVKQACLNPTLGERPFGHPKEGEILYWIDACV